jgi:predicted  nucleic acid-binding Zn-ribbon protein
VSVLTKVFVVLLTLLSIALSMLVVAAFSQQQNYKASMEDWHRTALDAQAKERTLAANAAIDRQRALEMHQQDLARISELQARLEANGTKLTEAERTVAESRNQLSVEQGQASAALDHNKLLQATLNSEKEFSARLARRNSELERGNIDLTDRVKELTVNVEMARTQVRALQQQIAAMEQTGAPAVAGLTPGGQVPGGPGIVEAGVPSAREPAVPAVAAPIRGEVRQIQGNLASISVGSADGVSPGMTFLVYRRAARGTKPMYLGTLRITRVEANESAGEIIQAEGDMRVGDVVRDEASFAMRG